MELRNLKYLLSLSENGSFTAAAKANYVTQPAVSVQLRKLQEELGTKLYEVDGRTVRFTRTGEVALEYAERFVRLETELVRAIDDIEGLRKGKIAAGMIDAASIYVLPKVLSRFQEIYPGIEIQLEVSSTRPLLRRLHDGALDIVIGTLPVEMEGAYTVTPIFEEPLVIISPPGHPINRADRIEPRMLSGESFISFHRESITRQIIEETLSGWGIEFEVAMAVDSQDAIKNLVASGLGLAVLPSRTVMGDVEAGSVALLDVEGLTFKRRLGLILPAGRYMSTTVRAFLGVLEEGLGIKLPGGLSINGTGGAGVPLNERDGESGGT